MKDSFVLRTENRVSIDRMSNEDAGALFKAILAHADGDAVDIDGEALPVQLLFPLIAGQIDRADARYQEICEKRSEAGKQGGRPKKANAFDEKQKKQMVFLENKKSNEKHNEPEPEPDIEPESEKRKEATPPKEKSRFAPPTTEDVRAYAQEHGLALDCARFVDFYTSKGWMVGKVKMKDWKAAARNWASRDKPNEPKVDYNDILGQLDRIRLSSG